PPNAPPVYDSLGKLNYDGWYPLFNPFGDEKNDYLSSTAFLNSNFTISYEILEGLKFSSNIGLNKSDNKQISTTTIASQNPTFNPRGQLENGITKISNIISEPKL